MNLLKIAISAALATGIVSGAVSAQNFKAAQRGKMMQASAAAPATYKPQTMRGQTTSAIVRKWAEYVRSVYGTSPSVWAKAMQGTFAKADVRNMQRAAKMTTFEGMMSALMGQRASDEQIIDKLARSDGSLAVIQALGSPSEDLVYTAVVPCRVFDTRVAVGALGAGETRHFISSGTDFTAQGGAATDCGIPDDASAVVMNVTAVLPASGGYLTVFPFGATQPLAASVNFMVGADNGNELIVKQAMGQASDFSVFAFSQSHVVGDVAGYFMAPQATAFECETVFGPFVNEIPSGTVTTLSAACPAGFGVTGGGNNISGLGVVNVHSSFPSSPSSWNVQVSRANGSTVNAQAVAQCCRVPGR